MKNNRVLFNVGILGLTVALLIGCLIKPTPSSTAALLPTAMQAAQPQGLPDLTVQSVQATAEVVRPGSTIDLEVVVWNRGAAAQDIPVRACDQGALCGECVIDAVGPDAQAQCRIQQAVTAAHTSYNPHFWTVEVDPAGLIRESNESNNGAESQPVFVVNPKVPAPQSVAEEDEMAVWRDGKVVFADRIIHPAGPDTDDRPGDPSAPSEPAPDDDHGDLVDPGPKRETPETLTPQIHPQVLEQARAAGPNGRIEAIIQYARTDRPFPHLPDLNPAEPRLSKRNSAILAERMAILEGMRDQRHRTMQPLMELVEDAGGRVLEEFVLGFAFHAEFPVRLLDRLAEDRRVRTIEPVIGGELPPNHDEVDDARDLIDADAYYNAGATGAGWYLGLLDTGVRPSHTLFVAPDHIDLFRDCVNGNADCIDTGNPNYDAADNCDHGTASAGIITGNSNLGDAYRGVSAVTLDSFQVYNNCGLNTTAVLRGFDRAVAWADKVIVAEMQASQSHTGSIAGAADDAFDAGSLVIGANGNNGPATSTVNSPANAHKALGIGAYDLTSLANYSNQSQGPTGDNRIKPDIRFPNNTETARGTSDTATGTFGGTSGATPYGGAAGILLVDWAQSIGWNTSDPGRFYAMLIGFGDEEYNNIGNIKGAGDTVLGTNDSWWRGSRSVTNNDWDYEPFTVDAGDSCIQAAIWWPEGVTWHNDIDLYLYDPNGVQRHHSPMVDSVFERVELHTNLTPGTWEIGIRGYSVKAAASPETVYYFIRTCD